MASSQNSSGVIIVHGSDADRWPGYLQSQLAPVAGEDVALVQLTSATQRAALDSLVMGKVVIVLATPQLLETLYDDKASIAMDFKLAGQCLLLLCGTELTEFTDEMLTRAFRDSHLLPVLTHTQLDTVVSKTETLLRVVTGMLPFDLIPTTVFCEHSTMVTVSFRETDVSKRRFSVRVADVDTGPAVSINRLTQCFTAPPDLVGEVLVHINEGSTLIGCRRLTYVSDTSRDGMQQLSLELLNTQSELLTAAGVSSNKMDDALDKAFSSVPAHSYQLLFSRFVSGKNQYDEELPSLLHWCAKYGLTKVNSRLLKLPNAGLATCVTNGQGHSAADLARIKRNSEIARTIDDQQNTEGWYADMFIKIHSMLSDDDLHIMNSYYNTDSIYAEYKDVAMLQTEEHYVDMNGFARRQQVTDDGEDIYTDPDEHHRASLTSASVPADHGLKFNIFRLTPEEREERLKDTMAPHLRELISIIEAVKGEERTIDDAEKLFKSWQDMYQRRSSVKKVPRPAMPLPEADKPSLIDRMRHVVWRKNSMAAPKHNPLSTQPPAQAPKLPVTSPSYQRPPVNGQSTPQGQSLPALPIPPRAPRQLSSNTSKGVKR